MLQERLSSRGETWHMKDNWDLTGSVAAGPNIDLTPLIDMMFMLLLFFILSTTFLKPAIEVDLPGAEQEATEQEDNKVIVVTIGDDGLIFAGKQNVTADLHAWMAGIPRDTTLDFQVDRTAPFQSFVRVVDEAKRLGHEKFTITTVPLVAGSDVMSGK